MTLRLTPVSRHVFARTFRLAVWVLPLFGLPLRAQETGRTDSARVTYVSGRSVYIDAGTSRGLTVGSPLELVRSGRVIGSLRVVYISASRASGEMAGEPVEVRAGDLVRFTVAAAPAAAPGDPAPDELRVAQRVRRPPAQRMRGRIGVRYLAVAQRDSGTARLAQPSADIRLDAPAIGGSRVGLFVDVRGRRTTSTHLDGTRESTSASRVYRLSLAWNAQGDGLRMTTGRQYSEAVANVSLFDGVSAEFRRARWSAGAFGGTQPDPVDLGLSSAIREYGAFVQMRNASGAGLRWSLTTGAIGSYAGGELNREFAYVQAALTSRRVAAFAIQEVDWSRGWKSDAGEPTLAPTSTFLSVRLRATEALSFHAGADSRRSVRLYRDRATPETEFDDRFRRGAWGGVALRVAQRVHLAADGRVNEGPASRGTAYSTSLGMDRMGPFGLGMRLRNTFYSSDRSEGRLHSLVLSATPAAPVRLELNGGLRDEHARPGVASISADGTQVVWWFGGDVDLTLARSWYLLLSATRETGGWESSDQLYGGVSYRF